MKDLYPDLKKKSKANWYSTIESPEQGKSTPEQPRRIRQSCRRSSRKSVATNKADADLDSGTGERDVLTTSLQQEKENE